MPIVLFNILIENAYSPNWIETQSPILGKVIAMSFHFCETYRLKKLNQFSQDNSMATLNGLFPTDHENAPYLCFYYESHMDKRNVLGIEKN